MSISSKMLTLFKKLINSWQNIQHYSGISLPSPYIVYTPKHLCPKIAYSLRVTLTSVTDWLPDNLFYLLFALVTHWLLCTFSCLLSSLLPFLQLLCPFYTPCDYFLRPFWTLCVHPYPLCVHPSAPPPLCTLGAPFVHFLPLCMPFFTSFCITFVPFL